MITGYTFVIALNQSAKHMFETSKNIGKHVDPGWMPNDLVCAKLEIVHVDLMNKIYLSVPSFGVMLKHVKLKVTIYARVTRKHLQWP